MNKDDKAKAGPMRNGNGTDLLGANSEIGRKLRQMYDDVISDAVPDRFSNLLAQLERAESSQKKD